MQLQITVPSAAVVMMIRYRFASIVRVRRLLSSQVGVRVISNGAHNELNDVPEVNQFSDPHAYRKVHQISLKSPPGLKDDYVPVTNFETSPFSDILKEVLRKEGFLAPTPTQAQSWPIALEKRDMISVARTGSGKTCAFLLPAFQQLLIEKEIELEIAKENGITLYPKHNQSPKVLVLAPTRELAVQIETEAQKFSRACGLISICLYGGVPKKDQILKLKAGIDIIIATPGRCIDLNNGKNLDLSKIQYLVLDEADRMLDMGFEPQIREIMQKIPEKKQSLFFSATWPVEVQSLANEFLSDAVQIKIGDSGVLNANKAINQIIMVIKEHEKTDQLIELLSKLKLNTVDKVDKIDNANVKNDNNIDNNENINNNNSIELSNDNENVNRSSNNDSNSNDNNNIKLPQITITNLNTNTNTNNFLPKTIIFVARKSDCDQLVKILTRLGYTSDSLHGDKTQDMRDRAMERFREGSLRILIATDVASRGLDIKVS